MRGLDVGGFLFSAAVLAAGASLAQPAEPRPTSPPPPNLIVISIDTLRADHLSAYGYARDTMGNMAYLRTDRWKYITPSGYPLERVLNFPKPSEGSDLPERVVLDEQLFDLRADPYERTNLATKNPEIAGKMRTRLREILDRCEAAAPQEAGNPVQLTEEERKRLESLGYVD